MSKTYSNEEKRQFVHEACAKIRQATELLLDAEALMKRCGVSLVAAPLFAEAYESDATQRIQVFSGIKKLAKLLGQTPRHPQTIWRDGSVDTDELGVAEDGFLFFQLGDRKSTKTTYHYR